MNKQWVESEKKRLIEAAKQKRAEIVEKINSAEFLTERDRQDLAKVLDENDNGYYTFEASAMLKLLDNHKGIDDHFVSDWIKVRGFIRSLDSGTYASLLYRINGGLERFLDSDKMKFDGDIIITDPCYIMRAPHHGTVPITKDDWDTCECGDNMEALGIHHYMTRDTIYGDWGCTVYNTDTKEAIGEFCADAGLVSVFLLDEVLKYNPDFDYHKERCWTTTLIPDFMGTVQFVVEHTEGVYEDTTEYHKAGDKWEDFSVHVVGHGVNKKTGEPINFYSSQSSM